MDRMIWLSLVLPLGGGFLACLAMLLSPRWRLHGGPLGAPLVDRTRACMLLLIFTALVLAVTQIDAWGGAAGRRLPLNLGGDAGLLLLALLPAQRARAHGGWGRAGFGRLPLAAVAWLGVLMVSVAVFRLTLLAYVPCRCSDLDPVELGWPRAIASGVFAAVVAPLTEEVLYRGITLPRAAAGAGTWGGILLSAFAWGMAHGQAPLLPYVALGTALGWLTMTTGSLWAAIGFHAAWNGAVVVSELSRAAAAMGGRPVPPAVIFVAVVGLLLGWARRLDAARRGGLRIVPGQERPGSSAEGGGACGGP